MTGSLFDIDDVTRTADISGCGAYRYTLMREWSPSLASLTFVMLNPSTADADRDDPTVRRCMGFARSHGYGGIRVVNLFALRATDPGELWVHRDPVGQRNDDVLSDAMGGVAVVLAWGAPKHAQHAFRAGRVLRMLSGLRDDLMALGLTKGGHPGHPLYLPKTSRLTRFETEGV